MIYLFLADGFEEVEALCPLDLLRRAGCAVTTVGVGGTEIRGAHGITVTADIPAELYKDSAPEMVILPGRMPGAKNLAASATVRRRYTRRLSLRHLRRPNDPGTNGTACGQKGHLLPWV